MCLFLAKLMAKQKFPLKIMKFNSTLFTIYNIGTIYQPLRSGRIWHKVNF